MSNPTEPDRTGQGGRIHWGEGLVATLLLGLVVFSLYFLVPKLEVYWANFGIAPPSYGRVLILMTRHLTEVTLAGLILVVLSFHRRA